MINLTVDSIVFNLTGAALSKQVAAALTLAAEQHLFHSGMQKVRFENVTTKTNLRAAFAKFVNGRVLRKDSRYFDESYVECAFTAYGAKLGHLSKELFDRLMAADVEGPYRFMRSYATSIKSGLGLFLVALHSSGAITLPCTFAWPSMQTPDGRRREVGKYVASELLAFIRTLDSQAQSLPHPAFETVGGNRTRREWFLSYATKLLLATGWHKPEDANVDELLELKKAERLINDKRGLPLAYGALLDVLNHAFPGRINFSSKDWTDSLRATRAKTVLFHGQMTSLNEALQHIFDDDLRNDHDLLEDILNLDSAWGKPERVRTITRLPGLKADFAKMAKHWLDLEDLYVSKVSREGYKLFYAAVGWWNIYLFFYLPYWFARNLTASWEYPSTPSLLVKSIFVSRLLPIDEMTPVTFIEFMNFQAEQRDWSANGFYGQLLNLKGFFEFVELYSDELSGCKGFTQPLAPHDFPKSERQRHTDKQPPVPRRFFDVFLEYYETLIAYHTVVLHKVLEIGRAHV